MTVTRAPRSFTLLLFAVALAALVPTSPSATAVQAPAAGSRQTPRVPPRDMSGRPEAPATGTATISGRVVDADTGQPLRRTEVSVSQTNAPGPSRRPLSVRTDDNGRYVARDLPPGQFVVSARRAGYVTVSYGQTMPGTSMRRISLEAGSRVTGIDFALQHAGAITGRVVDEAGEPAEGVAIQALRAQRVRGRTRYVPTGGRTPITDDLGHFRVYGLPPGEYLLAAEPNIRRFGGGPDTTTDDEAIDTITTYAPGTPVVADAQRFRLTAGEDVTTVIQLIAARVATVAGRVVDSSGQPLDGGVVSLVPQQAEVATRRSGRAGLSGGTFKLDGVAPGAYTLNVMASGRRPAAAADDSPGPESASVPIVVGGEDVEGLLITTAPPTTLTGRVVVEGDASTLRGRLRVVARPVDVDALPGPQVSGWVSDDLSVRVTGLRGVQRLTVTGLPRGWWVKAVRVSGQDALRGFDFATGRRMTGLEVVVNDRPASIGGQVTVPGGQPAVDYLVLVFSEDFDAIDGLPGTGSTGIGRPDQNGTYVIENIRPGTYFALAVDPGRVDTSALDDPDVLRELSARARTVTIGEGEQQYLSLTLVTP